MTSKRIYEAAKLGDEVAIEVFKYTGNILGEALSNTVAILSPEAFILFGGLAEAGDLIVKLVKKAMEANLLNIYKNKVKILLSELPHGKAAILGTGALIWNELSKS